MADRRPVRVLREDVARRIAAGEVIDRPAAIVRELMDNAVDSGADSISVEIEGGGIGLVKVSDNGSGMTRDEQDNRRGRPVENNDTRLQGGGSRVHSGSRNTRNRQREPQDVHVELLPKKDRDHFTVPGRERDERSEPGLVLRLSGQACLPQTPIERDDDVQGNLRRKIPRETRHIVQAHSRRKHEDEPSGWSYTDAEVRVRA